MKSSIDGLKRFFLTLFEKFIIHFAKYYKKSLIILVIIFMGFIIPIFCFMKYYSVTIIGGYDGPLTIYVGKKIVK